MTRRDSPKISKAASKDYTKVTFKPDLEKFNMTVRPLPSAGVACSCALTTLLCLLLARYVQELDDDIVALFTKRVYDMAGVTDKSVRVYLNGTRLTVNDFQSYIKLYQSDEDSDIMFERVNERWEVGIAVSDGKFDQVSFVNSICTTKGGQHVNYVADQVAAYLVKALSRKKVRDMLCARVRLPRVL